MSYVCVIRNTQPMNKSDIFHESLQDLAKFARAISHPARLDILAYLAESKTCISGDISDAIPLGRSTVSQHLKELKAIGLIHGTEDGMKINYCLCNTVINNYLQKLQEFFEPIKNMNEVCEVNSSCTTEAPVKNKILCD